MDLKEIKKIAKLFDMMSDYENVSEIVNYMKNDSGFTEAEIIKLSHNIRETINLFLFEIALHTSKTKKSRN